MTVATTTVFSDYTADGVTKAFGLAAYAQTADQVEVLIDGVVQSDALYVVSGLRDPGGITATFSTAPTSGTVRVRRVLPLTQGVDTQNNEVTYQEVFDDALDRQVMVDQQIASELSSRALLLSSMPPYVYEAGGRLIAGLADGEDDQDAATIGQMAAVRDLISLPVAVDSTAYASKVVVEAAQVAAPITFLRTAGYATSGDGGGALYRRVLGEPSHAGKIQSGDGAWWEISEPRIDVKMFGATGDGTTDDVDGIEAAAAYCNARIRTGLSANIKHAGAVLVFSPGDYDVASLAAPIAIECDVDSDGAQLLIDAAYDDEVFRIGLDTAGDLLDDADILLPNILKPSGSAIVAGSVGYRLANINNSRVKLGAAHLFERGVQLGGIGQGTVYNDIWLGQMFDNKIGLSLKPGAAGWCNANRIYGGNLGVYSAYTGSAFTAGFVHLELDGRTPATAVVGNKFFGLSLEGDGVEKLIDAHNAYRNEFHGCYYESGIGFAACSVSGDTLTRAAHGLSVGHLVSFNATVTPTGMTLATPYYVVAVPTADTFKVSLNKGGTAITFTSTGTAVTLVRHHPAVFSQTSTDICNNNRMVNWCRNPSGFIDVQQTGQAHNNGFDFPGTKVSEITTVESIPIFRARNRSQGSLPRPLFAAYGPTVDPATQPTCWSAALSDNGLLFGDGAGAEVGRLKDGGGVLQYRRPADTRNYELASCVREQLGIAVTGLTCVANTTTTTTLTLTGVAAGMYIALEPTADLPAGISIAWARASAADTITVAFGNLTGADIVLTKTFFAMATRRYY